MSKRSRWEDLSAGYRERLERHGITPEAHARGETIKSARGHEHTPEKPQYANRQEYPRYTAERDRLIRDFIQRKEELFGESRRFSRQRSEDNVRNNPPPLSLLRWALKASKDELLDILRTRMSDARYRFLGYT